LNYFDVLMWTIIFKNKKILLTYISAQKIIWKVSAITLPNKLKRQGVANFFLINSVNLK
jgi:hypothetical protein